MTKGRTVIKSDSEKPVIWKIISLVYLTYPITNQLAFGTFEEIRLNLIIKQKSNQKMLRLLFTRDVFAKGSFTFMQWKRKCVVF